MIPVTRVVFVCVKNGGKSQMAEALARSRAAEAGVPLDAASAGTEPGDALNQESIAALAEVGVDMRGGHPKAATQQRLDHADLVVVLGGESTVAACQAVGSATTIEQWEINEPSLRGVHGAERMRLVRDEIDARVQRLVDALGPAERGIEKPGATQL